jgi:hypothetical protein
MATVEELREQLKEAEKLERERDAEQRKAQSARWNEIMRDKSSFEWAIKPMTYKTFGSGEVLEGARISRRVKPEILAKWKEKGNSTFSSDLQEENRWFGMFYYRTDENILHHDGGGHYILKTPKLCSDEEWRSILNGIIPEKFL